MLLDKIYKYIDMVRNITQKTTTHSPHLYCKYPVATYSLIILRTISWLYLYSHFVTFIITVV